MGYPNLNHLITIPTIKNKWDKMGWILKINELYHGLMGYSIPSYPSNNKQIDVDLHEDPSKVYR